MRLIVILLAALLALPSPAWAGGKAADRYASIAVDENTGEVLHARNADKLRHPASLTKVMTLYLLFQAIEDGRVGLDDHLMVSKHAASAPPSKIGLKEGTTISVEDAIRAMVTKSANDAAIVVAERLGGGESRFAGQMTREARGLGMKRTRFANASGLPDRRQVTTARDMTILADAMYRDFPRFYHYFSLSKFVYDGRTFGNHNWLVANVKGVDGLKTGYTNDSGYNIAITAQREGHRVIVVVFGGATAGQRDSYAAQLVDASFTELARRTNKARKREWPGSTDFAHLQAPKPQAVQTQGLADQVEQGDTERRGVQIVIEGQEPKRTLTLPGNWQVQVGAYSRSDQAASRLASVKALGFDQLQNAIDWVAQVQAGGKTVYRARFKGLSAPAARSLCEDMQKLGEACIPLTD